MATISVALFLDIREIDRRYEITQSELLNKKFDYLTGVLSDTYKYSAFFAEKLGDQITQDVLTSIKDPDRIQKYLNNIDEDRNSNPIVSIIARDIKNLYINVDNDRNDPFVTTKTLVVSDYSLITADIQRNIGGEVQKHYNKDLAAEAYERIVNQDPPDITTGRLDNIIFWQFQEPLVGSARGVKEMRIESLRRVFMKSGGEVESLESFTFLYPRYIEADKDLGGRPVIDERGSVVKNSKPLILISEFSLNDAVSCNQSHVVHLRAYDEMLSRLERDTSTERLIKTIILFIVIGIFITTQLSTTRIVHTETRLRYGGVEDGSDSS